MAERRIWIYRHAESLSNAGFATADPTSIPLTEWGHAQANEIAASLSPAPALIVASPMKRALQTADALRDTYPHVPFEIWPVQEFVFLDLSNRPASTPRERRPLVEAYWARCDPAEIGSSASCESFQQFHARVVSFHQRVVWCMRC